MPAKQLTLLQVKSYYAHMDAHAVLLLLWEHTMENRLRIVWM